MCYVRNTVALYIRTPSTIYGTSKRPLGDEFSRNFLRGQGGRTVSTFNAKCHYFFSYQNYFARVTIFCAAKADGRPPPSTPNIYIYRCFQSKFFCTHDKSSNKGGSGAACDTHPPAHQQKARREEEPANARHTLATAEMALPCSSPTKRQPPPMRR